MFNWKRKLLLFSLVLGTAWLVYTYLVMNHSPLNMVSRWISAIERNDISMVCELTVWNGQPIHEEQALHIVHTLHKYPFWKNKIYEELQKDAVQLTSNTISHNRPWFRITRLPGHIHYRVEIPSMYIKVVQNHPISLIHVDDQFFSMKDESIGPFMALDTDVEIVYQNEFGEIIENYHLDLREIWGEKEVQLVVKSVFSAYNVKSNYMGGDLFIDHRYVGTLHGPTRIEPLSYNTHIFRLERTLPWGKFQSPLVEVLPDQKDIMIPMNYYSEELVQQLGETLVKFNESWNEAVKTSDPTKLNYVHPTLKKVMSDMIRMQSDETRFSGYFVQVLIDPSSIDIKEPQYGQFVVRLIAREDYAEGHWVDMTGNALENYEQQRFWEYTLIYTDERGWEVADLYAYDSKVNEKRDWVVFHSSKVLRIGVDAGLPPFESIVDGQLYGFDIDFMRWLGEKIDVTILFYEMPWNEIVDKLHPYAELDGAISAIDVRYAKELSHVLITHSYYTDDEAEYVIVLRSDLSTIYEKINAVLKHLHSVYRFEYNDIKRKHFDRS